LSKLDKHIFVCFLSLPSNLGCFIYVCGVCCILKSRYVCCCCYSYIDFGYSLLLFRTSKFYWCDFYVSNSQHKKKIVLMNQPYTNFTKKNKKTCIPTNK